MSAVSAIARYALLISIGGALLSNSPTAAAQRAPTIALLYDDELTGARAETAGCLARELHFLDKSVRVLDEQQVRDAFFPWFENVSRNFNPGDTTPILLSRMGRERAESLGLQFVVFLRSADSEERVAGPLGCGLPGQVGCVGAALLKRESALWATVWDFRTAFEADHLRGRGESRDAVVALGVPIWLPGGPSPRVRACKDLAGPLHRILHVAPEPPG